VLFVVLMGNEEVGADLLGGGDVGVGGRGIGRSKVLRRDEELASRALRRILDWE
jgi:methyl coenzyme M reductase subunit C-like uncharacterized protein (methanogenesis marker protein 7)